MRYLKGTWQSYCLFVLLIAGYIWFANSYVWGAESETQETYISYLPILTNGVERELCGSITGTFDLDQPNYIIACNVTIEAGATVNVAAGTQLIFSDLFPFEIIVDGTLNLNGTVSDPVLVTSEHANPSAGDWRQIYYRAGSSGVIQHAEIEYGGEIWAAVHAEDADVTILNTTVRHSDGWGVRVKDGTFRMENSVVTNSESDGLRVVMTKTQNPIIKNNQFINNNETAIYLRLQSPVSPPTFVTEDNTASGNGSDMIFLQDDGVVGSMTFHDNGMPYVFNTIEVAPNRTVTIERGVTMKVTGGIIKVEGTLNVEGTASQPVMFTSYHDDSVEGDTNGSSTPATPGDWIGIGVFANANLDMNHAEVRYAGEAASSQITILSANSAEIRNTTIRDGAESAILADDTSLVLEDSLITDHPDFGVRINGNPGYYMQPVVVNNDFNNIGRYPFHLILNGGGIGNGRMANNRGSGNPLVNGMMLEGYITDSISRFEHNPDFAYLIWTIEVYPDSKLVLDPDVVIKPFRPPDEYDGAPYPERGTGTVIVGGELVANGTSAKPVVFTSYFDDSFGGDTNGDTADNTGNANPRIGDWIGLIIYDGGSADFDWTDFYYSDQAIDVDLGGEFVMRNGRIELHNQAGAGGMGSIEIINSIISNNLGYGVVSNSGGDCTLQNSYIGNNGLTGVAVNQANCSVTDSTISENGDDGVQCNNSDCTFTRTTVENNTESGVACGTGVCVFQQGTLSNNGVDGIVCYVNCDVSHSTIEGNGAYGVSCAYQIPCDARDNYWGAASGPYTDAQPCNNGNTASGQGALITCHVNWAPYSTEPPVQESGVNLPEKMQRRK